MPLRPEHRHPDFVRGVVEPLGEGFLVTTMHGLRALCREVNLLRAASRAAARRLPAEAALVIHGILRRCCQLLQREYWSWLELSADAWDLVDARTAQLLGLPDWAVIQSHQWWDELPRDPWREVRLHPWIEPLAPDWWVNRDRYSVLDDLDQLSDLELASLRGLGPYQAEFLRRVGASDGDSDSGRMEESDDEEFFYRGL